jgi:hypothetical protein
MSSPLAAPQITVAPQPGQAWMIGLSFLPTLMKKKNTQGSYPLLVNR